MSVALVMVLGGGLVGDAQAEVAHPRRAPAAQGQNRAPATASRRQPGTQVQRAAAATPPAPTEQAVLVHYQRIGRDLKQLQELRGTDCTLDLWPVFRAIKLGEATATVEARIQTAATLHEIRQRIDRKRGITLRTECLNNPLAADCT